MHHHVRNAAQDRSGAAEATRADQDQVGVQLLRELREIQAFATVGAPHQWLGVPSGGACEPDTSVGKPTGLGFAFTLDRLDEMVEVGGARPQPPAQAFAGERRGP
ncbi:MAG TPA: hypothetical protein VFV66_07320 [Nonomuraea sp.]|nr:hypothetical protein [Nonomuraea sp.]